MVNGFFTVNRNCYKFPNYHLTFMAVSLEAIGKLYRFTNTRFFDTTCRILEVDT